MSNIYYSAISMGRQALDPAVEVAQMFNQDDPLSSIKSISNITKKRIKEGLKIR